MTLAFAKRKQPRKFVFVLFKQKKKKTDKENICDVIENIQNIYKVEIVGFLCL